MKNLTKELKIRLSLAGGLISFVLGLAFLLGACLAYLQRVSTQILPLAVTGGVCLVLSVLLLVIGLSASKYAA